MASKLFAQVQKELDQDLDNRRLQILNGLQVALAGSLILPVVAYGNVLSEVDEIRLPNGRAYRPWPRRRPRPGEKMRTEEWEQLTRGEYEFHADVDISSLRHLSPGKLLLEVERMVSADLAAISLIAGGSLRWYASAGDSPSGTTTRGRRALAARISSIIQEEDADNIVELSRLLDSIPDKSRKPLLGSMEWNQLGNTTGSLLVSFLCHWIAIEKQAFWLCKKFNLTKSDESIIADIGNRKGVLVSEEGVTIQRTSTWDALFGTLAALRDELNVSARTKVELAFRRVFQNEAERKIDALFSGGRNSLAQLRNDIAHGNIDEVSAPSRFQIEGRVLTVRFTCRDFLVRTVDTLAATK